MLVRCRPRRHRYTNPNQANIHGSFLPNSCQFNHYKCARNVQAVKRSDVENHIGRLERRVPGPNLDRHLTLHSLNLEVSPSLVSTSKIPLCLPISIPHTLSAGFRIPVLTLLLTSTQE